MIRPILTGMVRSIQENESMSQLAEEEKNRGFAEITEIEKIRYLIQEYLEEKEVFIKGLSREITVDLKLLDDENHIRLVFSRPLSPNVITNDELTVYTIVKRYIEITLKKVSFERTRGEFNFVKAKIAQDVRNEPRIDVEYSDFIAENFRLSKYSINSKMETAPIAVQIAFDKFRPDILNEYPEAILAVFDANEKDRAVKALYKTQKVLYIENTFQENSYSPVESDFLDYGHYLGRKFDQEMKFYKENDIKSLLIFPVIYTNIRGERTTVGYIKLASSTETSLKSHIPNLTGFAQTITDDIRDANIQIIKDPLPVMNVSKRGLQIKIADREVVDVFLNNREEMVLDIKPKPAFRITLFTRMANMKLESDNNYSIGMKIIGGEERHGISAWDKYLKKLAYEKGIRMD